ncbi:MAG TPA: ABC transporter permease, partial [Longimicrobiaceae bacterium]|nr:ABC transporter permease [Longimicrobiaceae bacterium]
MRALLSRVRSLWWGLRRRADVEAEMEEEFRLHVELRAEDLVRSGIAPAEALRRARLEFGSTERYKEEGRESRGLRHFDELRGDLRYAARALGRSRGFTAAAVLTLALGVGANAAVFSLVSASLLRPLPFPEAERLVVLHQTYSERNPEAPPFRWWSPPQLGALRARLTTLSHLAAYWATDANLSGGGDEPVRIRMELVSASYFPALGVRPPLGRAFLPQEDSVAGAHPVAILSHELWERRFGADPQVLGRALRLNGVPLTIVGVAPPRFRGLTGEAEVWTPQAMGPAVHAPDYLASDQYFLGLVGR